MELVLVMLIICIAMAAAAPSLRGFWGSQETKNLVTDVLSLTQWARAAAINQGTVYRLIINTQERTYHLEKQEQEQFVPLGTSLGTIFSMPTDTQMLLTRRDQGTEPYIDFYPNGRLEPATIRIVDRHGEETILDCPSPTDPFHVISREELTR
jgi:Tfp pilus assembly protein FimT